MVLVRQTLITDWQALRDIRLLALRDAPDAFASTYAREAAFGAAEWQQRATRDGSFIAFLPEVSPAGLAACYQAAPGTIELVGMFVRPRARGRSVGEALIDAVIGWARGKDAATVHLWVTETNKHGRRLYERCGFTSTGERQPLPSNPALGEMGMTRPLPPAEKTKDLTTERSRVLAPAHAYPARLAGRPGRHLATPVTGCRRTRTPRAPRAAAPAAVR